MSLLNGVEVIDRHNRPAVTQRVALRAQFLNAGVYTDPANVSSVSVFARARHSSPSSVLTSGGVLDASAVSGSVLMQFAPSGGIDDPTNAAFNNASDYTPGTNASSIFREGTGKYIVVLDGINALSGNLSSLTGSSVEIANQASAVNDYIDVWTVRLLAGSDPTTFINNFKLKSGSFIVLTEPLLLNWRSKLGNKNIKLGSKVDIKIANEATIHNKEVSDEVKNMFEDSFITSAQLQIKKVNEGNNDLPGSVIVSSFSDTSASIDITADNTIVFNWDTAVLTDWGTDDTEKTKREEIGSPTGTFSAQVKFTAVNQTLVSPLMFFTVS